MMNLVTRHVDVQSRKQEQWCAASDYLEGYKGLAA